jgi:hypothetical protein
MEILSSKISEKYFDLPLNEYAIKYSTGMKKIGTNSYSTQENKFFILDEPRS